MPRMDSADKGCDVAVWSVIRVLLPEEQVDSATIDDHSQQATALVQDAYGQQAARHHHHHVLHIAAAWLCVSSPHILASTYPTTFPDSSSAQYESCGQDSAW